MKNTKHILVLITFTLSTFCFSQNLTLGAAINKAGLQRALSQKMAKDYMMIGAGIRTEEAKLELDETVNQFNENIHDLVLYLDYPNAVEALNEVQKIWADFRVHVTSTPQVEYSNNIIIESTKLMNASNTVVEKLIDNNANKFRGVKLPAVCGLQRKNSQRIAMLYIAAAWGTTYNTSQEINDCILSFDSNLQYLIDNKTNTVEIASYLKFQASEWNFLKKTFQVTDQMYKPGSVASSTRLIFKDFDKLTGFYEKLVVNF